LQNTWWGYDRVLRSLDLGQAHDPNALVIVKKLIHWLPQHDEKTGMQKRITLYHLVHLERLKLGTPYPLQVARVKAVLERPPYKVTSV
jgi:hypothetical protein